MSSGNNSKRLILANEFATVVVEVDERGNGPRLRIKSPVLQTEILLDPLQLEALTWLDKRIFRELLKTPYGPGD